MLNEFYTNLNRLSDSLKTESQPQLTNWLTSIVANQISPYCIENLQAHQIGYINDIKRSLVTTLNLSHSSNYKAIYFEYDMDNGWDSSFYICNDYKGESFQDDDWACDYNQYVDGPSNYDLSTLYQHYVFASSKIAIEVHMFLIAYTVLSFQKACKQIDFHDIKVCIGFHDQEIVFRIVD